MSENILHPIFSGIVSRATCIARMSCFALCSILVGVLTSVLDLMPRSRSFQDATMTYRQVVEDVLKDTSNASADFFLTLQISFNQQANHPISRDRLGFYQTACQYAWVQLLPTYMSDLPPLALVSRRKIQLLWKPIEYTQQYPIIASMHWEVLRPEYMKADFICYNLPECTQYITD